MGEERRQRRSEDGGKEVLFGSFCCGPWLMAVGGGLWEGRPWKDGL